MICDPLGIITFQLPPGWFEYPGSSRLGRMAFVPWTDDAWVTVQMFPTVGASASDAATWRAAACAALSVPPDARQIPMDGRQGPAVLAHHTAASGEEQAVLIAGCGHLDVVARASASDRRAGLQRAVDQLRRTLFVTARLGGADRPPSMAEFAAELGAARDALEMGDLDRAEATARRVWDQAAHAYHGTVLRNGSELARATAALAVLDAMTIVARCTADASLAGDAETLARRILNGIGSESVPEHVVRAAELRLANVCELQLVLMGQPLPKTPLRSAEIAALRVSRTIQEMPPEGTADAARRQLLEAAVADASMCVVDARTVATKQSGALERSFLLASTMSSLLSYELLLEEQLERALAADQLAVDVAGAAARQPDVKRLELVHRTLVHGLLNLAATLTEIGDEPALSRADQALRQAESLLDRLDAKGAVRAWCFVVRGSVLARQGRRAELLRIADAGLAEAASDPATSPAHHALLLQLRAQAVTGTGDLAAARDATRAAGGSLSTGDGPRDRLRLGDGLVRLAGLTLAAGDPDEALRAAVAGVRLVLSAAPFGTDATDAFLVAAEGLRRPGLDTHQLALLLMTDQAAVASTDVRRALLHDDELQIAADDSQLAMDARQIFIRDLLDHGLLELAVEAADAGRARALMRVLPGEGDSRMGNRPTSVLLEGPPGHTPQEDLRRSSGWMADAANQLLAAVGAPVPLEAAKIRQLAVEAASVVVMPQPVGDRLVLLVVLPDGTLHARWSGLDPGAVVALAREVARGLRISAVSRGSADPAPRADPGGPLAPLSGALITPIADLLRPGVPLIVVPYRETWLVPFGLLSKTDGSPVGDEHPVSLVPSLATLHGLRGRGGWARPRRPYVVGDPRSAARFGLDRLAGAAAEAHDVARRLRAAGIPAEDLTVRTAAAATVRSYRTDAAGSDLVHLACHARLATPAAASCLFLAPDDQSDGMLVAAEVPTVRLADALVVLSACDTGQGRLAADGLVGLGRAFLQAGARAVVVSLWKVSDTVTAAIMGHLYASLLRPGSAPDLARAMQNAVTSTRQDLESGSLVTASGQVLDARPAHWAPFVVLGDAASIQFGPA